MTLFYSSASQDLKITQFIARASTRYARSDPRTATAALGIGKIHGPSLGGVIMYHNAARAGHIKPITTPALAALHP
jgi:hypothetical protein